MADTTTTLAITAGLGVLTQTTNADPDGILLESGAGYIILEPKGSNPNPGLIIQEP